MPFIVEMFHKVIVVVFLYSSTLMKLHITCRLLSCSDTVYMGLYEFFTRLWPSNGETEKTYIGTKVSAAGFEAVFN